MSSSSSQQQENKKPATRGGRGGGRWGFIDEERKEKKDPQGRKFVEDIKKTTQQRHQQQLYYNPQHQQQYYQPPPQYYQQQFQGMGGEPNQSSSVDFGQQVDQTVVTLEQVDQRFKKVAIVPYARLNRETRFLIGKERYHKDDKLITWSAFCAERGDDEDNATSALDLAARKFMAQTAGMFSPNAYAALMEGPGFQTDMNAICDAGCEGLKSYIHAMIAQGGLQSFARYIVPDEMLVMFIEMYFIDEGHYDGMLVLNDNQANPAHQIRDYQLKHDIMWAEAEEVIHLVRKGLMNQNSDPLERFEWFEDEEDNCAMQYLHPSFALQIGACEDLIREIQSRPTQYL